MRRPHCPRCSSPLEHSRATETAAEHVICRLCGWLQERESRPALVYGRADYLRDRFHHPPDLYAIRYDAEERQRLLAGGRDG